MLNTYLHPDTEIINLIVGTVIPFLTALLTLWAAPSWVKALCTALLTVAGAFCALALGPDGVRLGDFLASALEIFAAATLTYKGITKYIGTRQLAQATKNFGITAPELP